MNTKIEGNKFENISVQSKELPLKSTSNLNSRNFQIGKYPYRNIYQDNR